MDYQSPSACLLTRRNRYPGRINEVLTFVIEAYGRENPHLTSLLLNTVVP